MHETSKTIEKCRACLGTGMIDNSLKHRDRFTLELCPDCEGRGEVIVVYGYYIKPFSELFDTDRG
jgi:DnaJ-class molecular chaperone